MEQQDLFGAMTGTPQAPAGQPGLTEADLAFKGNDALLEAALELFQLRGGLTDTKRTPGLPDADREDATALLQTLETSFRARVRVTPNTVPLLKRARALRLPPLETELLLGLVLAELGLLPHRVSTVQELISVLCLAPPDALAALRALSESGTLLRKGAVFYGDPDEELRDRELHLAPDLVRMALEGKEIPEIPRFKTEAELRAVLPRLSRLLHKTSDSLNDVMRGYGDLGQYQRVLMRQTGAFEDLDRALKAHPKWQLSRARETFPVLPHWAVMLALAGKALCHVPAGDPLFTGGGLARAVCGGPERYTPCLRWFLSDGALVKGGYIQGVEGEGSLLWDHPEAVQDTVFELTDKSLELMGVEKAKRAPARKEEGLLEPRLRLADLALPPDTLDAVTLALDHVRHAKTLMDTWGLAERFPYGTGATMMFYGPPGTGKTATAEALAAELGRPLLTADYAKIQNCFVGQTEKNIVALFRRARRHNAVLFWDEADAMFHDRDAASRAWEVRDVNVLLQEIERFDGVCILATNRKPTLDKALARRITAKIEFPRPGRAQREEIWRKLLPPRMPLAHDVDPARLAEADLSGGEIKNVILNAARLACGRSPESQVTAQDLNQAATMELAERSEARRTAGFGR